MSYRAHVALAGLVLLSAIWLSSGTMAPYGATAQYPTLLEPCHYIVNIDHEQFEAVYKMIAGENRDDWEGSVVLRRILFPIVAFPLMKLAGFLVGGVIASAIVHLIALIAFGAFVRNRFGDAAAIAVLWLLATYPGITYWAGLPYSYVTIVPGSLACIALLYRLEESERLGDLLRWGLLMGIVFLGYDLFPFFGTAAVLRLIARRRWRALLPVAVTMALPTLFVALTFVVMDVEVLNSNTNNYFSAIGAYLHPFREWQLWLRYLANLPAVLASNFLFGNMIFLPILFIAAIIYGRKMHRRVLSSVDVAIVVSTALVFLFNNAAPPYYGWQMRGHWIARLYQPVFPAYLLAIARVTEAAGERHLRSWTAIVAFTAVANASIAFGPILLNPLAAFAYQKFYIHSPSESLLVNLRRLGRRPLGVCRSSHEWDNIKAPEWDWTVSTYMYRARPRPILRPRGENR